MKTSKIKNKHRLKEVCDELAVILYTKGHFTQILKFDYKWKKIGFRNILVPFLNLLLLKCCKSTLTLTSIPKSS